MMIKDEKMTLSFVSLKEMDSFNRPTGRNASGCIVEYNKTKFLLTVFHAVGEGKWALCLWWDNAKKVVKSYLLNNLTFLTEIDLKSLNISQVDFAVQLINEENIEPYFQVVDINGTIKYENKITIHNVNFDVEPSEKQLYSFAGLTQSQKIERKNQNDIIKQRVTVVKNMKFIKKIDGGNIYVFKLPHPYIDHKFYKGCSGAPILDQYDNIVALVIEGNKETDEIYGINMNKFKLILDIESGAIK